MTQKSKTAPQPPIATRIFASTIIALGTLSVFGCTPQSTPSTREVPRTQTITVYLVRHAEKQKGDDPALTENGHLRAIALKDKLADQGVQFIHSSNYRRTLETAAPLAEATGVDVSLYDPRDLEGFASTLKQQPGVHLVVGHSNTTPQLTNTLSGVETDWMPETEYNRFYTVTLNAYGDAARVDTTKYGAASPAPTPE